jgi:hypothetical protein
VIPGVARDVRYGMLCVVARGTGRHGRPGIFHNTSVP